MGVVPSDAELTTRHEGIPAWDDMPDDLKPVLSRQMEVYAGFLEHTDHHLGRLIDAIEELGALDDTLIFYILGDNGADVVKIEPADGDPARRYSAVGAELNGAWRAGLSAAARVNLKRIESFQHLASELDVPELALVQRYSQRAIDLAGNQHVRRGSHLRGRRERDWRGRIAGDQHCGHHERHTQVRIHT